MRESFLIEVKIGEIMKIDGESYICVRDNPQSSYCCGGCALYNTDYCHDFACIDADREDETDVHFVKQKGGEK